MNLQLAVFKGKQIRRTLHDNEWWFSEIDACDPLTDSADKANRIAGKDIGIFLFQSK